MLLTTCPSSPNGEVEMWGDFHLLHHHHHPSPLFAHHHPLLHTDEREEEVWSGRVIRGEGDNRSSPFRPFPPVPVLLLQEVVTVTPTATDVDVLLLLSLCVFSKDKVHRGGGIHVQVIPGGSNFVSVTQGKENVYCHLRRQRLYENCYTSPS